MLYTHDAVVCRSRFIPLVKLVMIVLVGLDATCFLRLHSFLSTAVVAGRCTVVVMLRLAIFTAEHRRVIIFLSVVSLTVGITGLEGVSVLSGAGSDAPAEIGRVL